MRKAFHIKSLNDDRLIEFCRKQPKPKLLYELYSRHLHIVKAVCWKMDRKKEFEDIWSEVFEKWVLQAQKQMPQNIGNWIYTVTKNHIIKKYWSKENYISIDEYEIEVVENIQWNDTSALAHLDAAMRQLKPTHRECLQWFYLEGLSYKAIAEKTLETENKIKSCLQNAKRNLLKILQSILKLEQ